MEERLLLGTRATLIAFKMTKSSRVRCVSKYVFFYSLLLEFEKQFILPYSPTVVLFCLLPHW